VPQRVLQRQHPQDQLLVQRRQQDYALQLPQRLLRRPARRRPWKSHVYRCSRGAQKLRVSAQWCSRGGVGFRSVCGDWQTWDVPTPQENAKVVTKCADGICVRVRIDGNFAKLGLTKFPRSTHRNIRYPVGNTVKQTEGNSVDFHLHVGHATVLVQACSRGGPLQHSSCTSWTTFEIP